MAGDWIKIRHDLFDDPAVIQMAARLEMEEDFVVGKLVKFWSWADRQLRSCHAPSVTKRWLDRYTGVTGFAEAMEIAGWLAFEDGHAVIPNFERHLSNSAKRRALDQRRKSRSRHAGSVTKNGPEKRREEKMKNPPYPPAGGNGRGVGEIPHYSDWDRFRRLAGDNGVKNPGALVAKLRSQYADPADAGYAWYVSEAAEVERETRRSLVESIVCCVGREVVCGMLHGTVTTIGLDCADGVVPWATMSDRFLSKISEGLK